MKTAVQRFNELLADAKKDSNILAFVLAGSRGKGFHTKDSDYDCFFVVKDKVLKKYKKLYPEKQIKDLDSWVMSFSELKKYGEIGTQHEGDRYDYARVKILVDKANIKKIIKEKSEIPAKIRKKFIADQLDDYINDVFRSIKCIIKKNYIGARLEAASSIFPLLKTIFAIENRVSPFLGYTEKEMRANSLKKLPWPAKEFIKKILFILETADLKTQQEVLKAVEKLARKEGYGHVFDAWEGKDKWVMNYKIS